MLKLFPVRGTRSLIYASSEVFWNIIFQIYYIWSCYDFLKLHFKEILGGHCNSKRCLLNDEQIKHSKEKSLSNESSDCTHLSSHWTKISYNFKIFYKDII